MDETARHRYWPHFLLLVYAAVWVVYAINPVYRDSWLLENYLVFIGVPAVIWSYRHFRLSNLSYTLLFAFVLLHTVGAHYTYAEVPFGYWLQEVFGFSRNHFDRIVHFSFGLLLAYPVREIFLRIAKAEGVWGYWLPVELTLAFSALYEIIEWLAVLFVNPEAGSAFLGTQGDEFDPIKDMALAGLGACIAMFAVMCVHFKLDRRFGKELKDSVRIKETEPLGEVALAKLEEEADRAEYASVLTPNLEQKAAAYRKPEVVSPDTLPRPKAVRKPSSAKKRPKRRKSSR